MDPLLQVEDLQLAYERQEAVRGVTFALERGAIGCLLGPSGCGKTTVLRCIAGFETDRKSTRLNSSHIQKSRMPSSA